MKRILLTIAVLCGAMVWADSLQQAQFVAGPTCLVIQPTLQTKFVAPLVDGKPDFKHGHLEGIAVTVDTNCGRIEITRTK